MNNSVSVIIPAYNAEKWITRAIDSVLKQTEPVGEILVVDDGSTDTTAERVKKYGPRVRLIQQANAGVSAARNRGIEEAKGEWIAFLDADDEWYEYKTMEQMAVLRNDPELRWCACNMEYVERGGRITYGIIPDETFEELKIGDAIRFFHGLSNGLVLQTSGFILHRSLFDQVEKFDTSMKRGEDLKLWCQIAFHYPLIGFSPEVCFRYYIDTPDSLMKNEDNRDPQLFTLVDILNWTKTASPQAVEAFYPFARKRAMNYLLRAAGNQITVSPEVAREVMSIFPPAFHERLILWALPCLPGAVAQKILNRLTL